MKQSIVLSTIFALSVALFLVGCAPMPEEKVLESGPVVRSAADLPEEGQYMLDTSQSSLYWEASRFVASPHVGTVNIKEGSVSFNDGQASGEFIMDMASIKDRDGSETLEKHLKSPDFFDVEGYPTSTFRIKGIVKEGDSFTVTGDLTILGKTEEISFPAYVETMGDSVAVDAEFTIDRTRWGITYRSNSFFADLGDKAIKDEIVYSLDLVFEKA